MLTFILQKPGVPLSSSQAASKKHSLDVSSLHVPGAKPARPRRSMVFRRLAPNWEKSHVRPSCPPKSAWQAEQATYDASYATLTTSPGRLFTTLHRSAVQKPPGQSTAVRQAVAGVLAQKPQSRSVSQSILASRAQPL